MLAIPTQGYFSSGFYKILENEDISQYETLSRVIDKSRKLKKVISEANNLHEHFIGLRRQIKDKSYQELDVKSSIQNLAMFTRNLNLFLRILDFLKTQTNDSELKEWFESLKKVDSCVRNLLDYYKLIERIKESREQLKDGKGITLEELESQSV